ncbi:hypothetical protein BJ944DRAFT_264976 [Cunninghamella echinulata]|nr:hypothetical protein BJ944DRAFT_264976 [Cunninghamella echinulata]
MRTLEDAILSETEILLENITKLNELVCKTNQEEVTLLVDKIRSVETKIMLVYTFLQSSLYSSNVSQTEEEPRTNRPAFL